MANFVLVPVIGNTNTITNALVGQYGIDSMSRPNATSSAYLLVGSTPDTTFYPLYCFWYNDSSYNFPLPCFVSLTNNSYKVSIISKGSTGSPTNHSLSGKSTVDGVEYWSANDFANNYGWWLQSLSDKTPYNSVTDGVMDILTSTSYVTVSYVSGVVSVAAPKLVLEGSTVTAYLTMPSRVTVTDSDITVTKQGVTVPFTYSNGVLTFTA